jgi:hypothetical protein
MKKAANREKGNAPSRRGLVMNPEKAFSLTHGWGTEKASPGRDEARQGDRLLLGYPFRDDPKEQTKVSARYPR